MAGLCSIQPFIHPGSCQLVDLPTSRPWSPTLDPWAEVCEENNLKHCLGGFYTQAWKRLTSLPPTHGPSSLQRRLGNVVQLSTQEEKERMVLSLQEHCYPPPIISCLVSFYPCWPPPGSSQSSGRIFSKIRICLYRLFASNPPMISHCYQEKGQQTPFPTKSHMNWLPPPSHKGRSMPHFSQLREIS